MRCNQVMLKKLRSVDVNASLDAKLERIVDNGFVVQQGCYFLKSVAKLSGPISKSLFFDEIGVEHSFNSFHIDSLDQRLGLNSINKQDALAQSVVFISKLFKKWRQQFEPLVLVATLSESDNAPDSVFEYSVLISFYVKRSHGKSWLADDLEGYNEEAIFEVDSQSDILSVIERIQSESNT